MCRSAPIVARRLGGVTTVLAISLLTVVPQSATARPSENAAQQADDAGDNRNERGRTRNRNGKHGHRATATGATAATRTDRSTSADPTPAAQSDASNTTAGVATSAPRTPGATGTAVTATTPGSVAGNRAEVPLERLRQTEPALVTGVTLAGSDQVATDAPGGDAPTQVATATRTGGLPLDPLVPASLGLLLLARALRRPTADDRTFTL